MNVAIDSVRLATCDLPGAEQMYRMLRAKETGGHVKLTKIE